MRIDAASGDRAIITMSEAYEYDLLRVVEQLKNVAESVEIRGQGAARFVFASNHQHTIELSQSSNGIWVECWNDQVDAPVAEATLSSYAEASEYARAWLLA